MIKAPGLPCDTLAANMTNPVVALCNTPMCHAFTTRGSTPQGRTQRHLCAHTVRMIPLRLPDCRTCLLSIDLTVGTPLCQDTLPLLLILRPLPCLLRSKTERAKHLTLLLSLCDALLDYYRVFLPVSVTPRLLLQALFRTPRRLLLRSPHRALLLGQRTGFGSFLLTMSRIIATTCRIVLFAMGQHAPTPRRRLFLFMLKIILMRTSTDRLAISLTSTPRSLSECFAMCQPIRRTLGSIFFRIICYPRTVFCQDFFTFQRIPTLSTCTRSFRRFLWIFVRHCDLPSPRSVSEMREAMRLTYRRFGSDPSLTFSV